MNAAENPKLLKMVGWITSVALIAMSFAAVGGVATYKFAFVFLIPLVWIVYWFRRRLYLHPLHYALFGLALLLHNLGAFGLYRRSYAGLSFDTYVHFYFGFVGGFIVARAFRNGLQWRGPTLWFAVLIFILGLGAVHELVEYVSTLILGPEKGMLKNLPDDPYDTQQDLCNNFLGTVIALLLYAASRKSSADRIED